MNEFWHNLFPPAFAALALAHFLALLSPGPDFFLIIGHAIRRRFQGAAFICVGIAVGNALYIALAILGWSGLEHWPAAYRALEMVGAAYLAYMGGLLLRSGLKPAEGGHLQESRALRPPAQFLAGLASALLNPKNAIFYLTLLIAIVGTKATLKQQLAAGVWMTLVVLLWDLALAGLISLPLFQRRLRAAIPGIEIAAGLVLCALAIALIVF